MKIKIGDVEVEVSQTTAELIKAQDKKRTDEITVLKKSIALKDKDISTYKGKNEANERLLKEANDKLQKSEDEQLLADVINGAKILDSSFRADDERNPYKIMKKVAKIDENYDDSQTLAIFDTLVKNKKNEQNFKDDKKIRDEDGNEIIKIPTNYYGGD